MGKKKGRETDQTVQRKHSVPRNPLAHNRNPNSRSSDRSGASAVTRDRKSVVEKTTTGALQLKELVTKVELLFPDIVANGILNYFVQDKSTGNSNQITISNEKGTFVSGHSVNAPKAPCILTRERPSRLTLFSTALISFSW